MKQTISFQLDKSLVDELKSRADAQLISTSALLRIILLQYLRGNKNDQ
jgi:hypothetical protein